ncbi:MULTISPECIES: methyltransferase [unclassified Frankia]|uniref:methyltransferase n=1 Tax=unclassified Frankia TaxID=2632575 RepID=UPI001EF56D90|nr:MULTISPECIES: methyltransferase [unclassified Frankia]
MRSNSDIIRASYEAFHRRDHKAALAAFAPDIEWTHPDGMVDYGLGGTKKGYEEILAFMARARTVFSELRPDPQEFIEQGDRVVVFGVHYMCGARSGMSGTVPFVHSWRLARGLATHFTDIHDTALVRRIVEGDKSPVAELLETHDGYIRAHVVRLVAELKVGDLIGDGARDVAELATATATDSRALFRLLRTATGFGLMTEPAPGRFALTEIGAPLRSDHPLSVRSIMVIGGGLFGRVFSDAEHSLRTGEPAFPKTFGLPLFAYLQQNPEVGAVFNTSMAEFSRLETGGLVTAYDFSVFSGRRIVDVGGGDGTLICAVLDAVTEATGVVFDQPEVADAARERIAAAGLGERCTVESGDFFSAVPTGGDLYILKWIIHDWPDEQALAILRNCRRAMAPGGRLLLVEQVVPEGDTPHRGKVMDFTMLVVLGGRERTKAEYSALLAAAGLRLERVLDGPMDSSILEALPDGGGPP